MARLTLNAFVTLDGVMQAPSGPTEDSSGGFQHGGWLAPLFGAEMGTIMLDIVSHAEAFLIGRGTYDIFSRHWPRITNPLNPIATKLNNTPKFVASRSVSEFDWRGCSGIADALSELDDLKQRIDGELQIHGSHGLAQTLIEHNRIDEYRLFVCPVLLGQGKRLFQNFDNAGALELIGARSLVGGVVYSVYRPAPGFRTGSLDVG